ncbi:MAG: hypothetical protein MUC48_25715 [Leptolyngbya sp. Prado105]|jgi:post-segregation antitoxin (ccd killing protein)|nr:hypothetical protein [Leptolyngbya sp. Prado105]
MTGTPSTIVGRQKKPAKRVNYKISYELLARLKAISVIEDRSDTAQLERYIRESSDRWELENPEKIERYKALVDQFVAELGGDTEE